MHKKCRFTINTDRSNCDSCHVAGVQMTFSDNRMGQRTDLMKKSKTRSHHRNLPKAPTKRRHLACKLCRDKHRQCKFTIISNRSSCDGCILAGVPCVCDVLRHGERTDLSRTELCTFLCWFPTHVGQSSQPAKELEIYTPKQSQFDYNDGYLHWFLRVVGCCCWC